ncbi:MAG: hypothetical protein GVY10_09305 [Verrucomicrobia bacterium]|jgi:thiamine transporter ThiT|nr:hypothetical protein [Verrucomicrobiota bacterium]
MLAKLVVGSLNAILNVVGWLVLLIATIGGLVAGLEGGFLMGVLGMLLGFAFGFIWVTVVLGLLFLLLDIKKDLSELNKTAAQIRDK